MIQQFKRLLVGLDFSAIDEDVIAYASFIANKFSSEKVYFLNVTKNFEKDARYLDDTDDIPLDEALLQRMKEEVARKIPEGQKFEIECKVVEGSPTKEILRWSKLKEIDLLILGRKNDYRGRPVVPQQIARSSNCSVLFVTNNPSYELKKIICPTDFSEYASFAMETSITLAQTDTHSEILAYHLYDLPDVGEHTHLVHERFKPIARKAASDAYEEFMSEIDHKYQTIIPKYQVNWNYVGAPYVVDFAVENKGDIIVVGSQGKTGLTRMFLGSFAEKLIRSNYSMPLLICKNPAGYEIEDDYEYVGFRKNYA